ncbi:MAG: hydrogenase maturation nickel metallochaperone HypA [Candidatus Obscuribacterales bacterium]|nr:hydrogenase maturation nickel metallochaperone HypA [Candidatus Obscuribacterales bacterium]
MHETAIAKAILDRITDRLGNLRSTSNATSVQVRVGEFRNVDPESLSFAFDSLKKEYPTCIACTLNLELIETRALCKDGRHEYKASADNAYRCPNCGSAIGTLVSGEELHITKIVVSQNK